MTITAEILSKLSGISILEFLIVYAIILQLLVWMKRSRSFSLIPGLLVVLSLYVISRIFVLTTLTWVLEKFSAAIIFLIIIIFQPDIRRFLEKMGRRKGLSTGNNSSEISLPTIIKKLLVAVESLSKQKIGALISIEMRNDLSEYTLSGVVVDAQISSELIINLFWPNTPTHDGALIIRENKILAAGCLLPLSDSKIVDRRLGTRHRAAIGLTEISDAIVIVISEETGTISLAENGNLTRFLNKEALETRLFDLYSESPKSSFLNLDLSGPSS